MHKNKDNMKRDFSHKFVLGGKKTLAANDLAPLNKAPQANSMERCNTAHYITKSTNGLEPELQ